MAAVTIIAAVGLAFGVDALRDAGSATEHSYEVELDGTRSVFVRQGDGRLELVGRDDLERILISLHAGDGVARDALRTHREGDRLFIEQDELIDDGSYLRIEVPSFLVADVIDGGGTTHIEGLAGLMYEDASGTTDILRITGDVEIRDGSGTLTLSDVRGQVHVVADGSGALDISSVDGDVTVDDDTSGPLDVRDVTGDLRIGRHGSGEITHEDIGGHVQLPSGTAG